MKKKIWKLVVVLLIIALALGLALVVKEIRSLTKEIESNHQVVTETSESTEHEPAETQVQETEPMETEPINQSISLVFGGDVNFAYTFLPNYEASGITGAISQELIDLMSDADICMVNNEFCFSTRGSKQDKQYTFRVDPKYATALNEMGVDIVTLANNHALDFGKEALSDTFTTMDDVGIKYCGAGETKDRAKELQVFEQNGKTIGFLAASRVIPEGSWNIDSSQPGMFCTYDDSQLNAEIKKAKEVCDYVVVYVHWGVEREAMPEDYQRNMGKHYIDAGADLVIGSHSHCLQGIEFYNGKPIFYSLGNYIFNKDIGKTMAVEVVIEEDENGGDMVSTLRIHPAAASGGKTYLLTGQEALDVIRYEESISFGVAIDDEGYVKEAQ